MNAFTRVSEKGQVVVPKAVRDRLGWTPGTELELVEMGGGVLLRPKSARRKISVDEAVERLKTIVPPRSTPAPIEALSWRPEIDDPPESAGWAPAADEPTGA